MKRLYLFLGLVSGVAILAAAHARDDDRAPEPTEYRTKDYRAPTPAGLAGARVVSTAEAVGGSTRLSSLPKSSSQIEAPW
jgi:hypothetical protein